MLDIKYVKKQIYKYLILSIFFIIFGYIYELFSHNVYSTYMMYAFLIPFILGTLIYFLIYKPSFYNALNYTAMKLYNCSIITLTIGSIIKGFLDIYGTTNNLIIVYLVVSISLVIISLIINIIHNT